MQKRTTIICAITIVALLICFFDVVTGGKLVFLTYLLSIMIAAGGYFMWRFMRRDLQAVELLLEQAVDRLKVLTGDYEPDVLQRTWDSICDEMERELDGAFRLEWQTYSKGVHLKAEENSSLPSVSLFSLKAPAQFFNEESVLMRSVSMDLYQIVPGVLTGIGLFFTFVGLMNGISSAHGLISGNAIDAEALGGLLDGAALAFMTSIAGLGSSLLFLISFKRYRQKIYQLILTFNATLEVRIPTKQSIELLYENNRIALEDRRILREMTSDWYLKFESLMENYIQNQQAFSKELTSEIVERIGSIDDSIKLMSEHQADQIGTMVSTSVDAFAQALSEEMRRMNDTFDTSAQSIKHSVESIDGVMDRMQETTEAITQTINTQVTHLQTSVEAMTERFMQTGEQVNTFSNAVRDCGQDFCDAIGSAVEETDKFRTMALQAGEGFETSVGRAASEFHEKTGDVTTQWGDTVTASGTEFNRHVAEAGDSFNAKLQAVMSQMQTTLETTSMHSQAFNGLLDKQHEALGDMAVAADKFIRIQGQFDEFSQALETVVNRIENGESSVMQATSKLLENQRDAQRLAQGQMQETAEEFQKRFDDLVQMQQNLTTSFEQLHETMADNVKNLGTSLESMHASLRKNITTVDQEFAGSLDVLSSTVDKLETTQDKFNRSLAESVQKAVKQLSATRSEIKAPSAEKSRDSVQ